MKKFLIYIPLCVAAVFASCKMELDPYSDPTNRAAFVYERNKADTVISYSFAYYPSDFKKGTITLKVTAIGFLSDQNRTVSIRQTNSGTYAAKAGVHYTMDSELVIPANATGVEVPVKLLRDESLQKNEYTLELSIIANDDFQLGNPGEVTKKIVFSDILLQPSEWGSLCRAYLGLWGREKMKLMIDAGAKYDTVIDIDWIVNVINANDYGLVTIWQDIFNARLIEINTALGKDGPLKEENGTIVSFDRVL